MYQGHPQAPFFPHPGSQVTSHRPWGSQEQERRYFGFGEAPGTPAPAHNSSGPPMGIFSPSDRGFAPGSSSPASPTQPRAKGTTTSLMSQGAMPLNPGRAAAIAATTAIKSTSAAKKLSSGRHGSGTQLTDQNTGTKKSTRDTKRRATHSQIERRRREKINDRLITLRNLVPACVKEVEERQRIKEEEEAEAAAIAAGLFTVSGQRGKRKRNRRKASEAKAAASDAADKEPELGLHKLEVLTHTIDYIYDLQARIEELETGVRPAVIKRAVDRDAIEEDAEEEEEADSKDAIVMKADGRASSRENSNAQRAASPQGPEADEQDTIMERRNSVLSVRSLTTEPNHRPLPISPPSARLLSVTANRHRSETVASDSVTTSPTMSELASPMWPSAFTASSSRTSLTSPFMSLSASSPIFMSGKQSGCSVGLSQLTLPPSAYGDSVVAPLKSPIPITGTQTLGRHGSISAIRGVADESRGEHQREPHSTHGAPPPAAVQTATDDASAAELLLAISNSPEDALKPQTSSRTVRSRDETARGKDKHAEEDDDYGDDDDGTAARRPRKRASVSAVDSFATASARVPGTAAMTVSNYFPAFATPQVRPVLQRGGAADTSHYGRRVLVSEQHRRSKSSLFYSSQGHSDGATRSMPGSAPGGAFAIRSLPSPENAGNKWHQHRRLVSPPPLTLDGHPSGSNQEIPSTACTTSTSSKSVLGASQCGDRVSEQRQHDAAMVTD